MPPEGAACTLNPAVTHACACTRVCLSGRVDQGHASSELSGQLPSWDISALTCVDEAGGTPGFLRSGFSKKLSPETPILQTWHAPALWGHPDGEAKISPMSVRRQTPWRPEPPPCPSLSPRTRRRPAPRPRGRHQGPLGALHALPSATAVHSAGGPTKADRRETGPAEPQPSDRSPRRERTVRQAASVTGPCLLSAPAPGRRAPAHACEHTHTHT